MTPAATLLSFPPVPVHLLASGGVLLEPSGTSGPVYAVLVLGALATAVIALTAAGRLLWGFARRTVVTEDLLADLAVLMRGEGGTRPLPDRVNALETSNAELARQLAVVLRLTRELVPNGGNAYRDEYQRDVALLYHALEAIAESKGLELPPLPPRPPRPRVSDEP